MVALAAFACSQNRIRQFQDAVPNLGKRIGVQACRMISDAVEVEAYPFAFLLPVVPTGSAEQRPSFVNRSNYGAVAEVGGICHRFVWYAYLPMLDSISINPMRWLIPLESVGCRVAWFQARSVNVYLCFMVARPISKPRFNLRVQMNL